MRYLLDTNILSELRRPAPNRRVVSWVLQNEPACGISELLIGELTKGAHFVPEGKRRDTLLQWIGEIERQFEGKVVPLDRRVMKRWGALCGDTERKHSRRLQVIDSLIGASALTYELTVVTRNLGDFPPEVPTYSPWS